MTDAHYAGDAAWTEWFEICSVSGCSPANGERLRAEVESALYARLARFGLTRADTGDDDPVAFFDGYFKLKGSRERGKPLKLYFAHRIRSEGLRMVDFVCGTLFGSRSGRVHDIVIDWISSLKGWKARIVRGEDGVRRLRWEATGETGRFAETPIDTEPAEGIDAEAIRVRVDETLTRVARKIRVEKPKTALLLYATAMDVSLTESVVLDALGVGKSMAYRLRDRAMTELRACCARLEEADDPIFGRLLLEACEAGLETAVRQALGGGDGF